METTPIGTTQTSISASERTNSASWIRGAVFTALFAALFVAFSFVRIPLWYSAIPITLQTLAVMLAGGLLGAYYGFLSILIVVLLTTAGLPLLGGSGGLGVVFGPSGGYIWMFPLSALLIGFVSDRLFARASRLNRGGMAMLVIGLVLFSVVLAYVGGVPWYAFKAKLSFSDAMKFGCYPFLIGDFAKAAVAAVLIGTLRPLLARLR
ncbi:biotin transporter BioY [Paenibacillus sacheonensis]|uniref:Biotin transporter n=1 Tax=Paenibacillus sacheonensis TaxID=742054 RepID=A0A7X4YKV0_9BACL|nr:biotin transporter BioY [Paenibacillus sacheonensis]MBM7563257.1 biotin transport system substrate-specific component [Paenibacillus sacheonensis]NBC68185.1 biotin transporter BioY [Paenibacillus sacheonensis]